MLVLVMGMASVFSPASGLADDRGAASPAPMETAGKIQLLCNHHDGPGLTPPQYRVTAFMIDLDARLFQESARSEMFGNWLTGWGPRSMGEIIASTSTELHWFTRDPFDRGLDYRLHYNKTNGLLRIEYSYSPEVAVQRGIDPVTVRLEARCTQEPWAGFRESFLP